MSKVTIATLDQKMSYIIKSMDEFKLEHKSMDDRINNTNTRVTKLETYRKVLYNTSSIMREWKMWVPNLMVALVAVGIAYFKS